ncbi:MAG: ATP-dependent helicase [Azospirillaceae bacterium]|nr:ATP-dependent helicase [Azospirillaceae bacterium]
MALFPFPYLNPAQRSAVAYGVGEAAGLRPGPALLVIAGAGSGKTTTLAHRVANLILHDADPRRILLLTFGRRMAAEMIRRVEQICAEATAGRLSAAPVIEWAGTFHAIGARLLRLYADAIGLDAGFSILDRGDAADLMDLVRDELGFSEARQRFPKKATCLAIYSYAVNARTAIDVVLARSFPWCAGWENELRGLFAGYVAAKQNQNLMDYDDLLLYWAQMMQIEPLAAAIGARFDYVLVDEYQDTNALQAAVLLGLKPGGTGVTVVGDDAQSIYSFRSATVRNILDFPTRFDPPARVIVLEQNYRSTPAILEACNQIIAPARERFAKTLFSAATGGQRPILAMVEDETAQVTFVIDRILAYREQGLALRDQAVLFRAAHHSGALEVELTRRRIPFVKFGGLKFLEAGHVKDVVAILRWAENPRDRVAGFRVLKLLTGVGPGTARRALAALDQAGGSIGALERFKPPAAAAAAWPALVAMIRDLAGAAAWSGQLDRVRRWYDPLLADLFDNVPARRSDLDQLERIAAQHPSRSRFLTDMALDPPEATGDEAGVPLKDEDWLVLSTIHSAKGQEWRSVFVLNVVDGCIPSDLATGTVDEIEEERRLLYVAMTRARDHLALVQPLRFSIRGQRRWGDAHIYAPRSRFISDDDLASFEIVGGVPAAPLGAVAVPPLTPLPAIDLKQRLRAMWQ